MKAERERVVLVTGATDGIGRQTALDLLKLGFRVLVHGRTLSKAENVTAELRAETQSDAAMPVVGDLSSMAEVTSLAEQTQKLAPSLDVLINNAGVFEHERKLTVDGHERTFAINHLAPFLLSHLLLPAMRNAPSARLITVSSIAHSRGRIDFSDLRYDRHYHGYTAYAGSKLANVLFAFEMARRLRDTAITSNALHPGVIGTKLLRSGFGAGGAPIEQGAVTSVRLASDPSLAHTTGKYFADGRETPSAPMTHDLALAKRLYEESARLVHISPLPAI